MQTDSPAAMVSKVDWVRYVRTLLRTVIFLYNVLLQKVDTLLCRGIKYLFILEILSVLLLN